MTLVLHSDGVKSKTFTLSKFKHNVYVWVYACDVMQMQCDEFTLFDCKARASPVLLNVRE